MKVFIVFAHPEPQSFGAALLQRSIQALKDQGDEVQVSDLYAMNFNPIASANDFQARRFPDALQYDREQKFAHEQGHFAPDIQSEIEKLKWCDFLILQFPLWWFSTPAIMKGWIDRVFANGLVYGSGKRFETGGLQGKKAMLSITTGCFPNMVESDGLLGDLRVNLYHLNNGTFGYSGLRAVPPFVAWSIHYTSEQARTHYLEEYAERMRQLNQLEVMPMHGLSDVGNDWKLKADVAPRTVGHWRGGRQA